MAYNGSFSPFPLRKKGEKLPPLKERLAKIGLVTDWDYVLHLPLRYEDETRITPISELVAGIPAQVEGEVTSQRVTPRSLTATVSDGTGLLQVRLIHFYPSQASQLKEGSRVRLYGEPRGSWGGMLEMVHPRIRRALERDEDLPKTLTPVYPAGEGITQPWLRKRISRALLDVTLKDLLPEDMRKRLGLPTLEESLRFLHHPPRGTTLSDLDMRTCPAWKRLKFDELLAQQLALRHSRSERRKIAAPALVPNDGGALEGKFLSSLPFRLTRAQERVWREVAADLGKPVPMNRLVQGDVGSGKTVVAALAALRAVEAGFQAAIMAPTEILAEQHYIGISRWLDSLGIRTVLVSGSQRAAEKRAALEAVAKGEAQVVIGTHALIQKGVSFQKLGLAIIDEQHRFGVSQRLALRAGDGLLTPHLLMLSATPIPRTLAMSYLADFDVSVIDELPPGRVPVSTKLLSIAKRDALIAGIGREIARGRQAYWVCPLVEESEELDLAAAKETFEELKAALPGATVGLIHGELPQEEKEAVMDSFKSGQTSLLVATTVIEVGVDVPNATIMVIEHAERFGLAQLHQLRGRIGRGDQKSWCMLLHGEPLSENSRERLNVIRNSTDGFEIARRDLEIRGPGEFLGARQSGVPMLRFASLEEDGKLLEEARNAADEWLRRDPGSALKHAGRWFSGREGFLGA
ncbi:MAG: ATP-dependent DNA helicase RecG [Sutterellaceae bacterium]|nr:ATP-dependent DNA helicase RecG [Sutterellaceae bacterium]MDY2869248.1 ATP-dependent DNA helicase RecG [Mesosutterella sp.]